MGLKTLISFFLTLLLFSCSSLPDSEPVNFEIVDTDSLSLIPFPQQVDKNGNIFKVSSETVLNFHDDTKNEGNYLLNHLNKQLSTPLKVNVWEGQAPSTSIYLDIQDSLFQDFKEEGYQINISQRELRIHAQTNIGIMRGIQTLLQLFIPEFHSEKRDVWYLPGLEIIDYPQFQHRGLLLDVCRHFFDKDVVKKYIDALAYYKMNVLHLHLTEDQGWRMPIDKYPLLNDISSWRLDTNCNEYGGYYTKEDLKEIVTYASERHITVIPEIELPGHSQAALAAYPQFSCNGGPIDVVNEWGVFKEIYCAGNDSTFLFLEDILSEVLEIFPSTYIHIGGDEAPKFRWEHCTKCQKRMRDEGLADEHALQSYFIQRIEQFLNEKGRQLIGWDEILEGGLSDNATVQSWRGMEGGKKAAEMNHQVIMSPTSHCYLDYPLSSIDLEKIYSFDPIPADIQSGKEDYIIGGECNMWTERVSDEDNLDSKVFPRIMGLAEVLWTYPEKRDFENLYHRVRAHQPALTARGINYGFETTGAFIVVETNNEVNIQLKTALPDVIVKYRWLGDQDGFKVYSKSFQLDRTDTLILQAFRDGKTYGDSILQDFANHKGIGAAVEYHTELNPWYPGNGNQHLFDGVRGSANFRDGNWQGFSGDDLILSIDLGKLKSISAADFQFYHYPNAWIFMPKEISFEWSVDQQNWSQTRINQKMMELNPETRIVKAHMELDDQNKVEAQYLKVVIKNYGKVPKGHDAEGEDAWLFVDEIVLY